MIKNRYVAFAVFIAVFLVMWNVLNYIYSAVITSSTYIFSPIFDIVVPAGIAALIGYIAFLRNK